MRMVPLQYRDGSSTMSDDDQTGTNPASPPERATIGVIEASRRAAKPTASAAAGAPAACVSDASTSDASPAGEAAPSAPSRPLSEPARRALAEAEARRAAYEARVAALPKELGGRGGKEPGRYGDWEVKGIATDF
jgi:hypothetical protein